MELQRDAKIWDLQLNPPGSEGVKKRDPHRKPIMNEFLRSHNERFQTSQDTQFSYQVLVSISPYDHEFYTMLKSMLWKISVAKTVFLE